MCIQRECISVFRALLLCRSGSCLGVCFLFRCVNWVFLLFGYVSYLDVSPMGCVSNGVCLQWGVSHAGWTGMPNGWPGLSSSSPSLLGTTDRLTEMSSGRPSGSNRSLPSHNIATMNIIYISTPHKYSRFLLIGFLSSLTKMAMVL